jgi:hypothetical protein
VLAGKIEGRDNLGVDERILLKCVLRKLGGRGVEWIHLAQDKEQWRALVNTVTIFGLYKRR